MPSYINPHPLSAIEVQRITATATALNFERLCSDTGGTIDAGARGAVARSAARHVRWVRGKHDHLT